jgi:hypothetical protein
MVFHEQRISVACYRHEKSETSYDSAIDNSASPAGTCALRPAHWGMAATRTGNAFRKRTSKVTTDLCAVAVGDNGECGRLGGPAMIPMSIFWALVLALFATNLQQPNERK